MTMTLNSLEHLRAQRPGCVGSLLGNSFQFCHQIGFGGFSYGPQTGKLFPVKSVEKEIDIALRISNGS